LDHIAVEGIMRQSTLNYLRNRYLELEKEIANASLHNHDLTVADLKYRKSIIAEELEHHRRLVQRFSEPAKGAQRTH
jgi:hypothetical protein